MGGTEGRGRRNRETEGKARTQADLFDLGQNLFRRAAKKKYGGNKIAVGKWTHLELLEIFLLTNEIATLQLPS